MIQIRMTKLYIIIKNTIAKTNDGTIKSKCPNLGGKKLTLPKESIWILWDNLNVTATKNRLYNTAINELTSQNW